MLVSPKCCAAMYGIFWYNILTNNFTSSYAQKYENYFFQNKIQLEKRAKQVNPNSTTSSNPNKISTSS